jgi:hypothetical protein
MQKLAIGGGVAIGIVTYSGPDATAMKKRSRTGDERTKGRRPQVAKPTRNAPKVKTPPKPLPDREEKEVN